ncbi:hypothetical protein LENED_003074 [Lentinula edodes]|uniref:Uncharacterized protein n=1 Tax=Lentinula edodes TaxID=5353 RepID=A0A1Q3E2K3_LENED|nr:hypothetical protein LENED_003074 [Lentinula edodes]
MASPSLRGFWGFRNLLDIDSTPRMQPCWLSNTTSTVYASLHLVVDDPSLLLTIPEFALLRIWTRTPLDKTKVAAFVGGAVTINSTDR